MSAEPIEEVRRERTFTWDDPLDTVRAAQGRSGLELMQALVAGQLPAPPIAQLVGFDLVSVEAGRAVFELDPQEFHYNPIGSVHGGVYATMLDSAAGCAVHSTLEAGIGYTSVDLNVKFLRRLTVDTGPVRAIGTVTHSGRTMALAEARLVDIRDRLYATATSSCLILR